MKPGLRVRMGEALKEEFRRNDCAGHVKEFGECIGIVEGLVDYNNEGDEPYDPLKRGPEVNVRWQPSGLRYGYHPDFLKVVNMIIAVDGPAASGKGTLARKIADHYGLRFLDTGALYRATARDILAAGHKLDDVDSAVNAAKNIAPDSLDDPRLREPDIGEAASLVAPIPQVRAALLDYQRRFARRAPGAVLDGRDIGTIVCPDADVKLFIRADVRVRAHRRFLELAANGSSVTEEEVLHDLEKRDERDRQRQTSPLVAAADAHLLDTTNLDIESSCRAAIGLIDAALEAGGKAD